MSELVCLNCGREMEYDWAPCPNCGWKSPEPWDEAKGEDEEFRPNPKAGFLSKPRHWIQGTVWILFAAGLVGLLAWLFHSH
jgi:hypothetical protein